mmetsp:Transcript_140823/g.392531  ORF Transcript_140823/g.392531 Transcript_140823/m.392531 type:complete len:92 (-) Transcript_140823:1302-1577(-)
MRLYKGYHDLEHSKPIGLASERGKRPLHSQVHFKMFMMMPYSKHMYKQVPCREASRASEATAMAQRCSNRQLLLQLFELFVQTRQRAHHQV